MKLLLKALGGLAVLVLLLVVAAFFFPRTFRVERSLVIAAPVERLFPLVADFREWPRWAVWFERDPAVLVTYSTGPDANEVGGWISWRSEDQGNGRATFLQRLAPVHARYSLRFENTDLEIVGDLVLFSTLDGVRVTWTSAGDLGLNPLSRWSGLFLDRLLGPDFEAGLAKLKTVAETPSS